MEYKLNSEMASRVVNCLSQFPYKDVADIINCLIDQETQAAKLEKE